MVLGQEHDFLFKSVSTYCDLEAHTFVLGFYVVDYQQGLPKKYRMATHGGQKRPRAVNKALLTVGNAGIQVLVSCELILASF